MKIYFLAALLLVAVLAVMSAPVEDEYESTHEVEPRADRHRRLTCDLLSWGGVNHSACAANCIRMGKTGGRCRDGVCICRKTTIRDELKKRLG